MPRLTRWYLRAAMLHLGGALALGLLLQVPWTRDTFPAHLLGRDITGLLVASALLQLVAGWAFILNTWPRLRER